MVIAAYAVGAEDGIFMCVPSILFLYRDFEWLLSRQSPMAFLVIISLVPVLISTYISIAVPERSYVVKVLP